MSRFAACLVERLQATRLQLLDVYGHARAELSRPAPRPGRWCRSRSRSGQAPRHRRHLDARARGARRQRLAFAPGQFTMLCRVRRRRGADLDQRRPRRGRSAGAHRARGRARHRRRSARASPGRCSACAGRSAAPWPVEALRGRRRRDRRGRHRARAAAPGDPARCSPRRERYGRLVLLYGGALARPAALRGRARAIGQQRGLEVAVTVDSAGPEWLGHVGVVTRLIAPRRVSIRAHGRDALRPRGDDALRPRRRSPRGASSAIASTSRWSATCSAGSATAGTASSGRRSSAATAPSIAGRARAVARDQGAVMAAAKPTLAVWKFASCDGCQLSLLDCEDELLALADRVEIAYFLEATQRDRRGPLRRLAGRGLDHHAPRRRADPRGPPPVARADHDRRVRDRGRHPGAAQLRRRRRVHVDRLRLARLHLDAAPPRRRSARTCRSTSSSTAARSTSTSCSR